MIENAVCFTAEYGEVAALVYLWIDKHDLVLVRLGWLFLWKVLIIILDFVPILVLNFCRLLCEEFYNCFYLKPAFGICQGEGV